jgi:hypothetical protein
LGYHDFDSEVEPLNILDDFNLIQQLRHVRDTEQPNRIDLANTMRKHADLAESYDLPAEIPAGAADAALSSQWDIPFSDPPLRKRSDLRVFQ